MFPYWFLNKYKEGLRGIWSASFVDGALTLSVNITNWFNNGDDYNENFKIDNEYVDSNCDFESTAYNP